MLTTSKYLTGMTKFGFFFKLCVADELRTCPAHSMSMRGLSTDMSWTRLRSRRPQNSTCTHAHNSRNSHINRSFFPSSTAIAGESLELSVGFRSVPGTCQGGSKGFISPKLPRIVPKRGRTESATSFQLGDI